MATDILFPMYEILVEYIFGSVGVAIVAFGILLFIMMALTRTSRIFSIYWLIFYFMVMSTFYLGSLGMVLMFVIVIVYFSQAFIRLFFPTSLG